jgi:hypothetical protein
MGYSEFVDWLAYYETEPFGEQRADLHAAMIAATIVNVQRGKGKKPVKISQFLVDWWKDKATPNALLSKFRNATAAMTSNAAPTKTGGTDGT